MAAQQKDKRWNNGILDTKMLVDWSLAEPFGSPSVFTKIAEVYAKGIKVFIHI